ncbi:hypothetical protein VIGAN_04050900, partial [Vigna angularis var. angularis]
GRLLSRISFLCRISLLNSLSLSPCSLRTLFSILAQHTTLSICSFSLHSRRPLRTQAAVQALSCLPTPLAFVFLSPLK